MQTQISELYHPFLGFVSKRITNQEDAEDLTQEVFFKLSRSNKVGIDHVKSWVYTIAKNTITDYYRQKKIIHKNLEETVFASEMSDSNDAIKELSLCVETFINQLPKADRDLLILSELKEVPQKEIAKQLGLNYTTLRSKIQRGRKKLRVLFENCYTINQGKKGNIMSYEQRRDCSNSC